MRYIIIKFFPSDKIDYISHYFLNFLFSLIFLLNITHVKSILTFNNKTSYTLLIPTTTDSFEENKDLVFSRLSVNDKIIAIKKKKKKIILENLNKKINIELIEEDLIPEAFEIITKKNNYLDLKTENTKIKEIIKNAEIIEKVTKNKNNWFVSLLSILGSLVFFITFLVLFHTNNTKK